MMPKPRAVEEVCGAHPPYSTILLKHDCICETLRAYAAERVAQARAEEREACAKVVENAPLNVVHRGSDGVFVSFSQIAAAIRARGDEG